MLDFHSLFADTAVFGLPGKEVQQSCQRLPNERERDPEDTIPDDTAVDAVHFLQRCRDSNQWELGNHAYESNTYLLLVESSRWDERVSPIMLCVGIPTKTS